MAQNPVAIVATVEDVVVMPDASHIVITLDVGGPKVDWALQPELALNLVDACAKGYAETRAIKKVSKNWWSAFFCSVPGLRLLCEIAPRNETRCPTLILKTADSQLSQSGVPSHVSRQLSPP